MSASLLPYAPAVTGVVLLVVLLIGVAAGRAKGRWMLLTAGIVVIAAVGVVLTAVAGTPAGEDPAPENPAAELAALYKITLPLVIAYVAGWLAARGSWLRRFIVIAVGALLFVAFPYDVAGQATADAVLSGR